MKNLPEAVFTFFQEQSVVIVSTVDKGGAVHNSCKDIVRIDPRGKVYLLDLYHGRTSSNLKDNSNLSITAVNEHKFKGFCLKGRARIVPNDKLSRRIVADWDKRLAGRITQRIIRNIHDEKGHPRHPEASLPKPKYMIVMDVQDIVDLTPRF